MSWYINTFLCHACYISEYIYLHIFRVNFLLKRHLSRGHRISCPAHHLERTDNKPFVGHFPIKTAWRGAPLAFCNIAKAFKHSTICDSNVIQTHNRLGRKRTLNVFSKLAKWLACAVSTYLQRIHLNFRYRVSFEEGVPWHSGNLKVYIHSEMRAWHENNIQGTHFLGAIKIVARPITWHKMINIIILLFCVKMFQATEDSFYLEIVCPDLDIY